MTELNSKQFVQKFIESLKEWKKQIGDTRSEHDAAYFFDAKLKKFLIDYKTEISLLSTINCERNFLGWVKSWIYQKES